MKDAAQSGWETKTLGEVAAIVNGGTPKSKVAEYWGGGVQWLTPKDMGQMDGREIAATPRTITDAGLAGSSARLAPAGSVILSTRAPIGHLAMNTVPMAFNQGCRGVVPSEKLDPIYLFHFLDMSRELLNDLGTGTTFKELSSSNLKSVKIPLPPLEEQQRIVAVLDEAFEGLARARVHAEANLQNARALIEAGLGTAFNPVTAKLNGWDLSDLSSMAKLSYGYTTKANSEPNGPKFLRITDIQDGTVDWDNVPFCSTPPDDYERYRVKSGDILFARTGATTGKSYLMTDEIEAVAASYLIRLRLASMALKPEYLALFFQSDVYWETIRAGISGSTQGGFNASKLGELVVPVPPLAIQDVVISRLEEIQDQAARLTSTYFVKLQDLDDLRQSLLQKAFAGELT